jgi:hypothetical protein
MQHLTIGFQDLNDQDRRILDHQRQTFEHPQISFYTVVQEFTAERKQNGTEHDPDQNDFECHFAVKNDPEQQKCKIHLIFLFFLPSLLFQFTLFWQIAQPFSSSF